MPLAPAQSPHTNAHLGHDGLRDQMAATHDHSVPHTHDPRPSDARVEVSPVLVGVGSRVLAVCALLSLLWLAIFWAFVGNV